nr:MAG TPA: hypothetical protein [Caudoviricetes sp.]
MYSIGCATHSIAQHFSQFKASAFAVSFSCSVRWLLALISFLCDYDLFFLTIMPLLIHLGKNQTTHHTS